MTPASGRGVLEPARGMISVRGLRLGYGGRTILDGVSFEVAAGDFWFLLGANGTGKSTLLRALMGLLQPRAGQIAMNPALAGRRAIGFVPQGSTVNASLPTTVREFVSLGLVGQRVRSTDRLPRIAEALARVGLAGRENDNFWTLSGGQRQRVLLARALARRPALLVMDEPTAGLDPAAEQSLMTCLASLNRDEHLTVLCVSHDLATAARYASHVALFAAGGVCPGPVREVLTRERLARVYGVALELDWDSIAGREGADREGLR